MKRTGRWLAWSLVCLLLLAGCKPAAPTPANTAPTDAAPPDDDAVPDDWWSTLDPAWQPPSPPDAIDPSSEEAGFGFWSREDSYVADLLAPGSPAPNEASLRCVLLERAHNPTLPFNVLCYMGEPISAVVPAGVDLSAAVLTFGLDGASVSLADGTPLLSEETALDLRSPQTLTLHAADGSTRETTLQIQTLDTGLPSFSVATEGFQKIESRTAYRENTRFQVSGGDPALFPTATESVEATGGIKGRGNTTWSAPKKSYTIKLEHKAALLGLAASKDWVLQANYEDKSLLRNAAAHWLAAQTGLAYTPAVRPVELWLNGFYWGSYLLMEKIEIAPSRVNITPFDAEKKPDGVGYLLEFDGHVSEVPAGQKAKWESVGPLTFDPVSQDVFMPIAIGGKWLTVKKPSVSNLTPAHAEYIYAQVKKAVSALQGKDYAAVERLLDVRSFARWYLVEELFNNADSSMHSSVYMTLDVGGKFTLGPVWDFDRSTGNCDYWNQNGAIDSLMKSGAGWFKPLFQFEQARAILLEEWEHLRPAAQQLPARIGRWAGVMAVSQRYNFTLWDILNKRVGSNPEAVVRASTYEAQVELLQNYLEKRTERLDKALNR